MRISILTFDGFNELDSLIALGILNRVKDASWQVSLCAPSKMICSMNNVVVHAQSTISDLQHADVVIIGSGNQTRQHIQNEALLDAIKLDPSKQLIAAQCSGSLILAKLGFLKNSVVCVDLNSKPIIEEFGVKVLDQAFYATGNIATAGGCLAAQYLALWVIAKTKGIDTAINALYPVAPVGEKDEYITRALKNITPYL